ncbi:MAG: hypothetical protein PUD72_01970 [Oscillospiraceae bacterium]|nr:hypothetical protein [Oscillospiraceae bacterium]
MAIIYFIVKIITIPGTLLKAFLEHLACRMFDVPVEFSKYIQKNELCGHIEHVLADKKGSFGICFMPHIISLFSGIVMVLPASMNLFYLGKVNIFSIVFIYVGISCLTNCFPLLEDAINMWSNLYGKESTAKTVSKVFMFIPAIIMYAGAYIDRFGITLITSILFSYALPYVLALVV